MGSRNTDDMLFMCASSAHEALCPKMDIHARIACGG